MKTFLRRHVLWAGFLAVLAPLLAMLVMQYRWLVDLQAKSAIAHEATLKNYLEAVATEVQYFYRNVAERSLNLPPSLFTQNHLEKAAYYFGKKGAKGARTLFLMSFVREDSGKLLFYDPAMQSMEVPTDWSQARSIYVASAPWQKLSEKDAVLDAVAIAADERDRDNRIILNPIVDETSRLVGLAGMILDMKFFEEALLPKAIHNSMPAFFSDADQKNLVVRIRDGKGKPADPRCEVEKPMTFVFTDYRLGLSSRGMNPKEWAQASFTLNMTMSALIAVVLLGGVALALRAASRQIRLSQMKSDFVSNVSHELRTPLASIRVFGEFLRMGRVDSPEKVREYGEYIETESRRLTGLVNNILDFARIESGRKTYRFEPSDLGQVVADTLKTFEVRLRHSGFRIDLEGAERPLHPMTIDADAISQAVGNLLDNAVKYSGDSRRIAVRLGQVNGRATIAVQDHGIGISRDEQQKVFERFHRVGTGLVHDVKGSGLGLSIVQHIVQAHGGEVSVQSDPGRGSTFTISLPVGAEGRAHA